MPQREANFMQLDDNLNIEAYQLKRYMEVLDNTQNAAIVGKTPLGVLDGDLGVEPITSIPVSDYNFAHLDYGDTLKVFDPLTMRTLDEYTVGADTLQGDTSITVNLQTPAVQLYDKYIIALDEREKLASNSLKIGGGYAWDFTRVLYCRTTNATITECTTNGLTGSGITNRILVPEDSTMTCEFIFTVKQESSANYRRMWRIVTFVNNGGTVTMPDAAVTPSADVGSVALAAVAPTLSANNGDNAIKVEFTGIALTTLNCSVSVRCNISKYG